MAEPERTTLSIDSTLQSAQDLVIEALALDEIQCRERLASVLVDREIYRELAQVAFQRVADLTTKLQRLRDAHYRLREDFRAAREGGR